MDARPLKHAVRSAMWGAAVLFGVTQAAGFVILSALLKLLDPSDFGLLGMVIPVMLGVRTFVAMSAIPVIQRSDLSPAQLSLLFWVSQATGLAGTVLIAAAAPLLAWYNRQPELASLTLALSGTSAAFALGAQQQQLLQRELQHARLVAALLLAQTIAGVAAIAAAWAGWGVWSLVVLHYVEPLVIAALLWVIVPWRPSWPRWAEGGYELLSFSSRFTAASVVLFVAQNVDKVLLGATSGELALGLYSQAHQLMSRVALVVTGPLSSIVLPALSRAKGQPETYANLLAGFSRLMAVILFPATVGLAIVAPDVILVLADERRADAGQLLRVLALATFAQAYFNIAGTLFTSAGRVDVLFASSWLILAVMAAGASIGLAAGVAAGDAPLGLAVSYPITLSVVICPLYLWWCMRSIDVPPAVLATGWLRPALAATAMGVVVVGVRIALHTYAPDWPVAASLAVQMLAGMCANALFAQGEIRWFLEHWRELRAGG